MALSKMPKTLGLSELKKGYFPHFFNSPDNQNYIENYRSSEYYCVDFMSVEENSKFLKWYEEQRFKI